MAWVIGDARGHDGTRNIWALETGVKIVSGSDPATNFSYHGRFVEELVSMVDAGMKPIDMIVAATSRDARLLGMQRFIGRIREECWRIS